jgi:hypothetical protein
MSGKKEILKDFSQKYTKQLADLIEREQPYDIKFPIECEISGDDLPYECKITSPDIPPDNCLPETLRQLRKAVYIITTKDVPENLVNRYVCARGEKGKKLAISQFNDAPGALFKGERCVYVGSTANDSLYGRLSEHLGFTKTEGAYALHLKEWWKGVFHVYIFAFDNGIKKEELQTVEDTLWEVLKPIMGKKGSKSKPWQSVLALCKPKGAIT